MSTYVSLQRDKTYASQRVVRVMAVTLQAAALMLLLLNIPPLLAQARILPVWWTVLALIATAGSAIVAVVSGRWIPRWLRYICGAQAILVLTSLVLVPIALGGERLPPSSGAPWLTELCVIAGAASAVCWGARGALPYGIALQLTVFGLVFISDGDPIPGQALSDAILGVFYVTLFTALAVTLRRAGFLLDRTVENAVHEARESATADAIRVATRRVAALVHDSVIAALLTYSRSADPGGDAVTAAQRALTAFESLELDGQAAERSPTELAWGLQALTTELDLEATFEYSVDGDEAIPANVAQAISAATSEALRNSIRHARAETGVAREVRVAISSHAVEVLVLDDGGGFGVRDIEPGRLGIRQAIIGRMEDVSGRALVSSTPGYGTIVALRWARDEAG